MEALMLDFRAIGGLTDDELFALCASNKTLRIERTKEGEIMLLHPTGGGASRRNSRLNYLVERWNEQKRHGVVFDSNGGFLLQSGAMRAPDTAFVLQARWDGLSEEEQEKFVPLCPDFVLELRSKNDNIADLQKKVREEWMQNGCRLAWLLDPFNATAYIFRADGSESTVQGFDNVLSGEEVLPDFVLELKELR
jgi:Uma2 family endonuclease